MGHLLDRRPGEPGEHWAGDGDTLLPLTALCHPTDTPVSTVTPSILGVGADTGGSTQSPITNSTYTLS